MSDTVLNNGIFTCPPPPHPSVAVGNMRAVACANIMGRGPLVLLVPGSLLDAIFHLSRSQQIKGYRTLDHNLIRMTACYLFEVGQGGRV